MGSIFTPKISTPAPPPPATYRDEVGGTEQVPVTNPDGSVTYVTRSLPLSAEQQKEQEEFKKIMTSALDEIQRLSNDNFADDPAVKSVLDDYRAEQTQVLENVFESRKEEEESRLALRGLGDSAAAEDVRRRRSKDELSARTSLERQTNLLKDDIRNERIGLQQNLYNISATQRDAEGAKKFQSALAGFNSVSSINAYNRATTDSAFRNSLSAFNTGVSTAQTVGGTVGGLFGGGPGAVLGTGIAQTFARR